MGEICAHVGQLLNVHLLFLVVVNERQLSNMSASYDAVCKIKQKILKLQKIVAIFSLRVVNKMGEG